TFFFSSRRRHTRSKRDWSSDVCSSDLRPALLSRRHADYFYRAQRDEAARQLPSRQATNVFRVASLEKVSRKQLVHPQLIKPRVHKQAWLYREVLVAGC